MLQHLAVKNLAIVEEARVTFGSGLNVITGETGAGKSVLIGALDLVLGERADRGAVRAGAAEAAVEAVFSLADSSAVDAILTEAGLSPCEEGQLIVRRTVGATGTGRCLVNDASATLQTLRRLGVLLVDMHGPYDHQSLLAPDFQLELLDAFGQCADALETYRAAYGRLRDLRQRREELAGDTQDVEAETDRLRFVVDELSSAALTEADGDGLVQRHAEAANAEAILATGSAVTAALAEGEGSAFDALAATQQRLAELGRILPEAQEWRSEAQSIARQVQELSRTVTDRLQHVDADPGLLGQLEERMALVQKLKRKYGATVGDMLQTLEKQRQRLGDLQSRGERLEQLAAEIESASAVVGTAADALSKVRQAAGRKLCKAVTAELRDLGFAKAGFSVELLRREPGPGGGDEAVFGFAPNPGEPLRPLRSIASSGEMARVMLAVKTVLARHDRIPLLVFDEIDANIGGETGRAVGLKLRAVAAAHQVICITHLPQVAAYGQTHLVVTKRIEGGRTSARIEPVMEDARAGELARMLGGRDMTPVTLNHARHMLAACSREVPA